MNVHSTLIVKIGQLISDIIRNTDTPIRVPHTSPMLIANTFNNSQTNRDIDRNIHKHVQMNMR